jgi:5-methylcytosine-specific restriction enzyme subunit McrC
MPKPNVYKVFEHDTLLVGRDFEQGHYDALVQYNDRHEKKYFEVGYRKITFTSYVGVIQVGQMVIEVLPKIDRHTVVGDRQKWHTVLLQLLRYAGYLSMHEGDAALQRLRRANVLDIYLHAFLQEVDRLVYEGLLKKYRRTEGNQKALAGRLLIEKHLSINRFHREKFYTQHTIYDTDHVLNGILKAALLIVRDASLNAGIRREASRLLLWFESVGPWRGDEQTFDNLVFNRKSSRYKEAIQLARMMIFQYNPSFQAGGKNVLALLFDMNTLFEKFIYRMLKRQEAAFSSQGLKVTAQTRRLFWEHKTIRPDILVSFYKEGSPVRIVIDTKWKVVRETAPSDEDLRQMFTYNIQFGADHSLLVYPYAGQSNLGKRPYATRQFTADFLHCCELYFVDIFQGKSNIDVSFANTLLRYLVG